MEIDSQFYNYTALQYKGPKSKIKRIIFWIIK